jgi:hypothetical protein
MAMGTAVTVPAPNARALADLIDGMAPCCALALGSINAGTALGTTLRVVTADALKGVPEAQRGTAVIARTREFVQFVEGRPAWLLLDHDRKGMPADVQGQLDAAGGFRPALLNVAPGLARAAWVFRASTSTGLSRSDTGEPFPGSGGAHLYISVKDGADIDRALRALHDRCVLHDLGWHVISTAGQLLPRSIVDLAVRFPERLVFEGAPDVRPPLLQDAAARACVVTEGEAIDTRAVLPDLTADEREAVEAEQKTQRQKLEPQAQVIRAACDQRLVDVLIARTGMPRSTAMRQVAARHRGVLTPDIELITDHMGTVTVREILAEPERFLGETLCDPLEGPAYGHDKAIIMRSQREPGRLFVHSFAHGRLTYDLKHDLRSAKAVLETTPVEQLGAVLCEVVDDAELEEDEVRQLLVLCAERAPKVGIQAFTRRLKNYREERARARRRAAAEQRSLADTRIRCPAPPPDGELTPVITEIDRVLSADATDYPPMRRPDGALVEVKLQAPFDMHQLAVDGDPANGKDKDGQLPPPPEPLLVSMKPVTVRTLIERYFVWECHDKNGNHNRSLAKPYLAAFMEMAPGPVMPERPISNLPHVQAVVALPMVAADGTVIDGIGLDRHTGLFFYVEEGIRDRIPRGPISADDVRNSLRFLLNEWLVDVLMDTAGKLIVVAKCATMIQRHLLPERPGFLTSAGLRGGGKTTTSHMETVAVFNRMATAASWSPSVEERRKATFSYFRQGVATITWDNIPDGTEITCPEIEKALTAPFISDRVLKESATETVPATTVMSFNGNNIRFGGALSSRGLTNRLVTDDPRPEDRQVAHTNPIGWTVVNRAKILRAIYTLLVYGGQNRPPGQTPKTRFHTWWTLVGWPVELAARLLDPSLGFDFIECFKATEAQDTQKAGVASALRLLIRQFGSIPRGGPVSSTLQFGSVNIRSILDAGEQGRMDPSKAGAQVQIDTANEFLDLFENLYGKRLRRPSKNLIGEALNTIVDRPEELDHATVGILRSKSIQGVLRFHVETHTPPPAAEHFSSTTLGSAESGQGSHSPPADTGEDPQEGRSGNPGHFSDSEVCKNTNVCGEGGGAPPISHEPGQQLPEVEELRKTEQRPSSTETISRADDPAEVFVSQAPRTTKSGQGDHFAVAPDVAPKGDADQAAVPRQRTRARRSAAGRTKAGRTNGSQPRTEERY